MLFKFLFAYLDDLSIFSNSFSKHLEHLKLFFDKLRESGLTLAYLKCNFAKSSCRLLGYYLFRGGRVAPDPAKTEAISLMPAPLNPEGKVDLTKLRSYLGMVTFYKRFIPNHSQRCQSLYSLLRKDCNLEWQKEHQKVFEDLKQSLIEPPLLVGFRHSRKCVLHTDSSDYACGAVLHQETEEGHLVVICYISRLFNNHEINYSTCEKECASLIYALEKLRPYLYAKSFTVVSDNSAVCSLMKLKCSKSRRLNRWICT